MANRFDGMTEDECRAWIESAEFRQLNLELLDKVQAGETLSLEYCAEFLGLPFKVFALGLGAALARELPDHFVFIDPSKTVTH